MSSSVYSTRECDLALQIVPQERTPGVGREEEEEEGKRFGGEDDPEVEEVKAKIAELESRIEEVEDYELAGERRPILYTLECVIHDYVCVPPNVQLTSTES